MTTKPGKDLDLINHQKAFIHAYIEYETLNAGVSRDLLSHVALLIVNHGIHPGHVEALLTELISNLRELYDTGRLKI
jgi:hypothetical protein